MVSFWPKQLIGKNSPIDTILRAQANELPSASGGLLFAKLEQTVIENVFVFIFRIFPRGRPEHTYELFRLRAPNGDFPVAIEVNHFEKKRKIQKAGSVEDLELVLQKVFSDEKTIEIINLLGEGAAQQADEALDGSPLLIGDRMFKGPDGSLCAMVSFFGVSSFINIDALRRLIGEPDSEGSAYEALGAERFVATIPVKDALKMTLTKSQIEALRSAARVTLASEASALRDD